jgi:methylmalonyl-CoA mutase cobalamin-binding domain/chain
MTDTQSIEELKRSILEGDEERAASAATSGIEAGVEPLTLINQGINASLDEIGQAFQAGELYLPELILAGDAAKAATDVLMPHISSEQALAKRQIKAVVGTVQGDMHDIGKNIVAAFLAANGITVIDLGIDVPPKKFMEVAQAEEAQIIAISTLLTTTQPLFRQTMRLLEDSGQRGARFVIMGGGPVTPQWVKDLGADGYGRDAKDAVDLCWQLSDLDAAPPLETPLVLGALKH